MFLGLNRLRRSATHRYGVWQGGAIPQHSAGYDFRRRIGAFDRRAEDSGAGRGVGL